MIKRRKFIKTTAFAAGALTIGLPAISISSPDKVNPVGGFTKLFQNLSYEETARIASELGWDCIECPVRPGGQVLPERVEEDLPRMVEVLKKYNLTLEVMATSIHNPEEKYTEQILKTASKLGIKYYRMGWWKYDFSKSIDLQLENYKSQLRQLSVLNNEYGITGVYQNHSGGNYVGAPIWDIYELLDGINTEYTGVHFDIGHATVESGYSWPIQFHRIEAYIKAVIVKDFKWLYVEGEKPKMSWCPIGQGSIDPVFFKMLRDIKYHGPITMHHEYEVEGSEKEKLNNLIQAMKNDTIMLRKWLND